MRALKPKIRLRINGTGTKSWCVDTGVFQKRRQRRFFKTKAEATSYASQLTIVRNNQGLAAFSLTEAQRLEAVEAFEQLRPTGATLREAVKYYLDHVRPKGASRLTEEVAAQLVECKRKKGFKPRYVKALRVSFSVFNRTFGSRPVNTIAHTEVDGWLEAQPYSSTTKRNYIRDLGILFRYAMDQGDCPSNVIEKIELPKAEEPVPSVVDVAVISRLLTVAQEHPQHGLTAGW